MNCTIDAHKIDCNCLVFADLEMEEGAKELTMFLIHCLNFLAPWSWYAKYNLQWEENKWLQDKARSGCKA